MWQLILNGDIVAELRLRNIGQPFFYCDFLPTPAFALFAPLYAESLRLLKIEDFDAWELAYDRIDALNPRLVSGNEVITEFLLHIEDGTAWFRY